MWVKKTGKEEKVRLLSKINWTAGGLRTVDVICDKCQKINDEDMEYDRKCSCGGEKSLLINWEWRPDAANPSLTPPLTEREKDQKFMGWMIVYGIFVLSLYYVFTDAFGRSKQYWSGFFN